MTAEHHPPSLVARGFRAARGLASIKGVTTLANRLTPARGAFTVVNGAEVFSGDLSSFIDRQVYLTGGYERVEIDAFLTLVEHKRVALDVGANAGTHTIAFGHAFEKVHAFEPNPALLPQLERNIAANPIDVTLHRYGLGESPGSFPLFDVSNGNNGLATLLSVEQYDSPLRQTATVEVKVADDLGIEGPVDAVKIDVQGFEPQVLRGMQHLLARDRPAIWCELGAGTDIASVAALRALVPYDVRVMQTEKQSGLRHAYRMREVGERAALGNVFIVPA